jgi:hypothetical protein
MPQVVAIDSRLPPSAAPPEDPTNPLFAIKSLKSVENQAAADTRYDVKVNLREGFSVSPERKMLALISAIILALIVLVFPQPLPVRVVLGVAVIYGLHYILGKLEKPTV